MNTTNQLKVCSKCKESKDKLNFNKYKKGGLKSYCKDCEIIILRTYKSKKEYHYPTKLYSQCRANHRERTKKGRKLEFTVTPKDIENLLIKQNNKCYWTSLPFDMDINNTKWKPYAPSVDRLDNSKGYTPDNICITLWAVNRMRGNLSVEEFTNLLNNIKKAT